MQGYKTATGLIFLTPVNLISDGEVAAHQGEMVLIDRHVLTNLTRAQFGIMRKYDLRRGMSCEHPIIQ